MCTDIEQPEKPLIAAYLPQIIQFLEKPIKSEDKIAYIRSLEFLIKATTKSKELVPFFNDLLLLALKEYATTDLLTKLNIVEVVPELANHPWTTKVLMQSNFIPALLTPDENAIFLNKI